MGGGVIIALAGGVGGAKLVQGFAQALPAESVVAVVNTGDDFEHFGMRICPDLDTVMYTLAGVANPETGWGRANETWRFMQTLEQLGGETWFRLGDQDLATHAFRTHLLAGGRLLSSAIDVLRTRFGVPQCILPMSDDPVSTVIQTNEGALAFQEYFVRRRCEPVVRSLHYRGAAGARPPAGFTAAMQHPDLAAIVICPSNPYLSIAPILEIPDVREALLNASAPVIAVSPIVAGDAIKGPAAKIMRELGHVPSVIEVARYYGTILDGFVFDRADSHEASAIGSLGIAPLITNTLMRSVGDRKQLALDVLSFAEALSNGVVT